MSVSKFNVLSEMSLRSYTRRSSVGRASNENLGGSKRTVERVAEEPKRRAAFGDLSNSKNALDVSSSVLLNSSLNSSTLGAPSTQLSQSMNVASAPHPVRQPLSARAPRPSPPLQSSLRPLQPSPPLRSLAKSTTALEKSSSVSLDRSISINEGAGSRALKSTVSVTQHPQKTVAALTEQNLAVLTRQTTPVDEQDAADYLDPRFVAEYTSAIFTKLWKPESQSAFVPGDYMSKTQPDLSEKMRGVLVDWLVEVHWKFKLYPETLFLCIGLLDRFLSICKGVPRNQLQLVGVTCLLIAAKYEDIYAPEIKDIVMICDRTYKKEEILWMEVRILNALQFQITAPSSLLYLLRLAKLCKSDERQFFLAQYCLELALPSYGIWVKSSPAMLASATLFLSNKLLRKSPGWAPSLVQVTGFSETMLKPIAKELCNILQMTSSENGPEILTKAVKKKFSQPKYHSVAKMVL